MGKVVKIDSTTRARPRGRRRRSRTALVLGGGGFTGGVYQIGALRALDLLSVNRSVCDFDVYVGTSAGSLIAALTANGVTPEQMMRVVNDQPPRPFPDINLDMLLRPNYREYAAKAIKLPWHLLGVVRTLARDPGAFSTVDLAVALADALPSGLYSGSGVEEYVRTVLSSRGPHGRLPEAGPRALPRGHRPGHLRAHRARRRGLGRRADLRRRARVDRAADGLRAAPAQGPRARRRRDRLHHEPRHRGRGRRPLHRRRQPAGALRQRRAHPPRVGDGLPEDRLPGVQAARVPAPARDGASTGRSATRAWTSC